MLPCQFSPEKKEPNKQTKKTVFLQKAAVRNLNRLICYPKRENQHFEGMSSALQRAALRSGAIGGLPLAAKSRGASPSCSRNKTNAQPGSRE